MLGIGKFLDQVRLVSLYLGLEATPLDGGGHTITTRDHNERTSYGYGKDAKDFGDEYLEFMPDTNYNDENIGEHYYDDEREQKKSVNYGSNFEAGFDSEYTIDDFKREYDEQFKDR